MEKAAETYGLEILTIKIAIELQELIESYNKTKCPELIETIELKEKLLKELKVVLAKNDGHQNPTKTS
jgi:hypothetical protein